jgi:hypothetical protein
MGVVLVVVERMLVMIAVVMTAMARNVDEG